MRELVLQNSMEGQSTRRAHLVSNQVADGFLSRADSLVPRTLGAVGIVTGNGARTRDGGTGEFGGSMRGLVLSLGLVLASLALDLVAGAASQVAKSVLDGASG